MFKASNLAGWGFVAAVFVGASAARATVVGYWRGEVDTDATAALSTPNEVPTGNPLVSASASLATQVPSATVPRTGVINAFSLNGDPNINGTVAHYAALDSASITVEFWARTQEGAGYLAARSTGTTTADNGVPATLTDGFAIDSFNAVRARFVVDDGGAGTVLTLSPATAINLDSAWVHLAFTYDAATGVGKLYADGTERASVSGTPGLPLKWGTAQTLFLSGGMDGGGLSSASVTGIVDELRISDQALPSSQFLNAVPEPGVLSVVGLCGAALLRRRRRFA